MSPASGAWVGLCRLGGEPPGPEMERALALLPQALRREVSRYRRPADRWMRLAARLLLKRVLAESGLARLRGLETWRRGEHGRPFLAGAGADLSLSHTRGLAASAVGRGCRVGVDVEALEPVEPEDFRPYLSPLEWRQVQASPRPGELVVRMWSRREAVLKADGRGLLAPEDELRRLGRGDEAGGVRWRVEELVTGDGWCGYLALDDKAAAVRVLEMDRDELLDRHA